MPFSMHLAKHHRLEGARAFASPKRAEAANRTKPGKRLPAAESLFHPVDTGSNQLGGHCRVALAATGETRAGEQLAMQLSIKGAAIAGGILWGGGVLITGLLNLANASYAVAFLQVMSSLYPGFHASHTFGDVIVGTLYGLLDGGVAGLILAWLYNAFSR